MRILERIKLRLTPMRKYPDYLRKKGMKIGKNCEIYKTADFSSEPYLITLGDHVRVNAGVCFVTHDGGCWVLRDPNAGFDDKFKNADRFGRIIVHNNVHIGTNAIIMPGVEIGENSIIACGAVVTRSVLPNSVIGGAGPLGRDAGRICCKSGDQVRSDKGYVQGGKAKLSSECLENLNDVCRRSSHSIGGAAA